MATCVERTEAEMMAAHALLELFYNSRVFPKQATATAPETSTPIKGTVHPMPEFRADVPAAEDKVVGPISARGPHTLQVKVTAGDSKRLSAPNPTNQAQTNKLAPNGKIDTKNQSRQSKNNSSPKWKLNLHKKYLQERRNERNRQAAEKNHRSIKCQTEHEKNYQDLVAIEKDLSNMIKNLEGQIEKVKISMPLKSKKERTSGGKVAEPTPGTSSSTSRRSDRATTTSGCRTSASEVANPTASTSSARSRRSARATTTSGCSTSATEVAQPTPSTSYSTSDGAVRATTTSGCSTSLTEVALPTPSTSYSTSDGAVRATTTSGSSTSSTEVAQPTPSTSYSTSDGAVRATTTSGCSTSSTEVAQPTPSTSSSTSHGAVRATTISGGSTSASDVAQPTPSTSSGKRTSRAKKRSCCSITTPAVTVKSENEDNEEEEAPLAKQRRSQTGKVKKDDTKTNLVPIGNGNARVPKELLEQLDRKSYTTATRKLLSAVFSRETLATHSLSGKPSPAFPDKPAKDRLDADIVNDIVLYVREHCDQATDSLVRNTITTKCADESKMLRSRMRNENKLPRRQTKKSL